MCGIEFELDMLMPKEFVDRQELQEIVEHTLRELLRDSDFHSLIAIYGMGGIGKSRFLTELRDRVIQNKELELFYSSLEIEKNDMLHSLICIRKNIPYTCHLFDYALLTLTDHCLVEKMSDEFLTKIETNLVTYIISFIQETISLPSPSTIPVLVPGLNSTIETINLLVKKAELAITKAKNKNIIKRLKQLSIISPKKLLLLLPSLLGYDLNHIAASKKLVVILDSCDSKSGYLWIDKLLEQVLKGVFIFSSREKLSLKTSNIRVYHMQEIPPKEAEKYLNFYIEEQHKNSLVPSLISITEGIPIYLDLAVSAYLRYKEELVLGEEPVDKLAFNSKEEIIKYFLDHLPIEQQSAILVLATIGIFDDKIFHHLISDLNLPVSKLDYNVLCRISLVDQLNISSDLKSFHTIFRRNVSEIISEDERFLIFRSYLSFLSQRGLNLYSSEVIRVHFLNVLQLVVDNDFSLGVNEIENILDVFFMLCDQHVKWLFDYKQNSNNNHVLFAFLDAISHLHSDVTICLSKLESIKDSISLLGKHRYSFFAIKYYSLGIKGEYSEVIPQVATICETLSAEMFMDWYYGKLKIYYADFLMLTGNFCDAMICFDKYYDEIEGYIDRKENDAFEILKQKGHCYRLNFWLEKADKIYASIYDNYSVNSVRKSYSLTCLCEARCYFNPQYVIEHSIEGLKAVKAVDQERSRAKIYYALGIANTVVKKYKKAAHFIRRSIKINEECHYPAGRLFALLAKCYYSYGKNKKITRTMVSEVETLADQLQVYGYLLLPIYLMTKNSVKIDELKKKYQWLDWDRTIQNYTAFIQSLS